MNRLIARRKGRARAALALLAGLGATGLLASPAQAAPTSTLPGVSTGQVNGVSYGSAILTGVVDPRGRDTSYYFQYGLTKAYGAQSAIADAGAGTNAVGVSLPVGGLQPLTQYHYRLVAVSSAGVNDGSDRTFVTTKIPLSLQIVSSPNPVLFDGPLTVQGTLSGTENSNREVVLQADTFPFTVGFQNIGNPELTTATGGFSFPLIGLTQATGFRVLTTTNPPVVSPVAEENVLVNVSAHIAGTGRPHDARFYGTVTPAEDGMKVGIMKVVHGHYVLVAGTGLHHRDATSSAFSVRVRVTRGVYRVLVLVTTGAQSSAYSSPLGIG
jgi:hypothetical protein